MNIKPLRRPGGALLPLVTATAMSITLFLILTSGGDGSGGRQKIAAEETRALSDQGQTL